MRLHRMLAVVTLVVLVTGPSVFAGPMTSRIADVDGLKMRYFIAGSGEPVLLIHGYAQSAHMWEAAAPALAKRFTVIAPDLPGFGQSDIPAEGLDVKSAASRLHALVQQLNVPKVRLVGHDIGLMVAYAYAAMYPNDVEKLVVLDAFLPGIGEWEATYHNPAAWHFFFNGPTAEALVKGRERIYFEHFWNDFAANPKKSLSDEDRRYFAAQYARPGRMRAGWAYFAAFPQTAKEFAKLGANKLSMPVLVISGDKAAGNRLGEQLKLVARNVSPIVLKDTGHWVIDERPAEVLDALQKFLGPEAQAAATQATRIR